jgi:hypothetical protein
MVTLSELYPSGGGGEITYPINSVRSPFDSADFLYWLERGKNFANSNYYSESRLINTIPSNDGRSPSLYFNSSWVDLTNANAYSFTQDRGISIWLNKQGNGNSYQGIVCKDNVSNPGREWQLTYINDGSGLQGKLGLFVFNSSGGIIAQVSATLTESVFQHWLLNYDHATTTWTLYRNGTLQDTQVLSGSYNSTSTKVTLGTFSSNSTSLSMQGTISQCILANRKFTPTEIALLYSSGDGYFTI